MASVRSSPQAAGAVQPNRCERAFQADFAEALAALPQSTEGILELSHGGHGKYGALRMAPRGKHGIDDDRQPSR